MNLSGDRLKELERAAAVFSRLLVRINLGAGARRVLEARLRLLHGDIHAERGKRISRPERSVTPRRISVKPPAPAGECRSSTLRFGSRRARRSTPTPSKRGEVPRRKSPERSAPT
jgi:hypothetical protein